MEFIFLCVGHIALIIVIVLIVDTYIKQRKLEAKLDKMEEYIDKIELMSDIQYKSIINHTKTLNRILDMMEERD